MKTKLTDTTMAQLENQIQSDIKAAMIAKDAVALTSIRAIKAAILLAKTSEGGAKESLEDEEVIKIIGKLVKQRKESAAIYSQQNREDLAQNELAEAKVMEKYLPKSLSEEEVEAAVKEIIAQIGASSMADMGKVMGVATKKLAGAADGRVISTIVKKLLS
ncbi:MAG: GatB/YqeY domain-containing protein [Candidatus Coprenecus sp.]|nr:GatB/YqeY domain-containing protein [Candidatus Coprenecus sp.]